MKKWIVFGLWILVVAGCGPEKTPQELASEHLIKAKDLLKNQQFTEAKLQIDSVRLLYPGEKKVISQGVLLLNHTM